MKKIQLLLALAFAGISFCNAQTSTSNAAAKTNKDSTARAKMIADSLRMEKLYASAQYPLIKGSKQSGIIPVSNPTEIPDPKREYKLLFKLTAKNPDSLSGEINHSIDEVVRILNLHVASGIPAGNLFPVIVIAGGGMEALMNNEAYRKKHSVDNPNLKVISELEKAGTKLIVCGQAMAFSDFKKEDLLPEVKISLTAKTVLSNYQLQGYVLYSVEP